MQKQFKMTKEGEQELKDEIAQLISKRGQIAERIKQAREFGDLSENAEYSAARQEQERNESRISEIDHILKNSDIITEPKLSDVVELGNEVALSGPKGDKKFTIVGSIEADPMSGKISNESPIGQSLMGKKVGDEIDIVTPAETATYKIKSVK